MLWRAAAPAAGEDPLPLPPGFAAALMEFVMGHEPSLMAFSARSGIAPEVVASAWQKLSGPYYGGTGA